MSEIGKQLKTIEAKIVNGFLIIHLDKAVRLKSIDSIEISACEKNVYMNYGKNNWVGADILDDSTLEDIIQELGVHL